MARGSAAERGSSGLWRVVGTNAASKIVVLGLSGALAVITTRLIIQHFGIDAYAQYGLLTSMAALVPFADLGMSAAVINVVAGSADPRNDVHVRDTLVSALRILIASAAVFVLLGIVISALGLWPALLGEGLLSSGGPTAALICVLVFAVTLPLGVGQRILTGLGKNQVQISAQALAAPFILLVVTVLVVTGVPAGNEVAVVSYLAGMLVAGTCVLLAWRLIAPQFGAAVRAVPSRRAVPGAKVMDVAWPMLAQMLALPIAMQTDRLLLSHLTHGGELAQYNLASQVFGLVLQTISAAGIALWPVFAGSRSRSEITSPYRLALGFGGVGLAVAGVLAVLQPWVVPLISDGRISLSGWLVAGFVAFIGAQALKYPLGMYMTDARGLRFQVLPILVLVPLNLGLSWYLIAPIGAAGPIVGSALAVFACQVLPNFWYVRRDLARRRLEQSAAGSIRAQ